MIYMVEMNLIDRALLLDFHRWYDGHVQKLLSIPGFLSAQRFESIAPADSPFLAVYNLLEAEVMSSPAYRAKAGPDSTGEWKSRFNNWHRNLLQGASVPEVPQDGWLALVDRYGHEADPLPLEALKLQPVGLDRTIVERGILVGSVAKPSPPCRASEGTVVRVFRPISVFKRPQVQ